ncbi:MAG: response regulator [Bacteroidia bacterium]|nr:response regulator [Bacteroidia bacterium]
MSKNRLNRSLTVMLIDDCEIDIFIHRRLITTFFPDFNVIGFKNTNDALSFLKDSANDDKHFHVIPDFILLDIFMPIKSGFEFLSEYKNINFPKKRIPNLIVVTVSINPLDKYKCLNNKCVKEYLIKPLLADHISSLFSNEE